MIWQLWPTHTDANQDDANALFSQLDAITVASSQDTFEESLRKLQSAIDRGDEFFGNEIAKKAVFYEAAIERLLLISANTNQDTSVTDEIYLTIRTINKLDITSSCGLLAILLSRLIDCGSIELARKRGSEFIAQIENLEEKAALVKRRINAILNCA